MRIYDDFLSEDVELPGVIGLSAMAAARKTGTHENTIYRLTEEKKFPQPLWLTSGRKVWIASEIDAWLMDKIAARDRGEPPPDNKLHQRGRKRKGKKAPVLLDRPANVLAFRSRNDDGGRAT